MARIGFARVARAFIDGRKATLKNDSTDGQVLRYHGNVIAERRADGSIWATLAGWNTATTRQRWNALAGMLDSGWRVSQRDWTPYLRDWRDRDAGPWEMGSREWTCVCDAVAVEVAA